MKRVLIITYYWPPSGGSGVQRWVKFVKYLRDFGWEPIIYVPENPEYPSEDLSFNKDIPAGIEILKTPIWEPYDIYRKLTGNKGKKINAGFISENRKSGWKDKLSIWIRGNLLIPDPRRFWIRPSVKFLSEYLIENPVYVIVTTGPPHSLQLIGLGLRKKLQKIPWVADFRDPWTGIYFFKDLMLTKLSHAYHSHLEKRVLKTADKVVVVSNDMKRQFEPFTKHPVTVITNGFDKNDVEIPDELVLDDKFSISYIGLLTPNQNPDKLWTVLRELTLENHSFRDDLVINLTGKIDASAIESVRAVGLGDHLIFSDYIPHDQAVRMQQTSQLLLLLLTKDSETAKGILTGKFFEYLASGRPIIAIGPTDSDVAEVLKETEAGQIADFDDEAKMKSIILEYYNLYKKGTLAASTKSIEKYSRKNLTKELAELLNDLT